MKFPLPKNIFPPLELTEHQEQNYEHLASKLIKATLTDYDRFVAQDRKRVNTRRWKTVRARDGITIYRKRYEKCKHQKSVRRPLALYRTTLQTTSSCPSQDACRSVLTSDPISPSGRSSYISSSPKKGSGLEIFEDSRRTAGYDSYSSSNLLLDPRISTRADDSSNGSSLPKLLAVGTLRGSLDDVMYGVVSPDAPSVRLRSSYLGEHIADCAVLREIKGPSPADPFHFLGIKWFVRAKHRGAGRILLPRDFVVLEYSGVMMRPDHSRVGFHLMHSVEISSCRQLSEHRILRAKLSSCYIFEETRNNCVQVFMTASVDPSGYVFTRMAVRSAAIALSNCWKSISCAYDKKLAFCLQNERPSTIPGIRSSQNRPSSVIRSSHRLSVNEPGVRDTTAVEFLSQRSNYSTLVNCRRCGVCRDKVGLLTKTVSCQLCSEQICHHCRIVRKLSCDTLSSHVTQSSISFCKKCVASVSDESAVEIARQEIWVRAQSRTRASSAVDRRTYRHSFSTERNTYAAVMLGHTSDLVSQESTVTNTIATSSDCLSQRRTPHLENIGCSVHSSALTQLLRPVKRPHSDSLLSKQSSLCATILSTGSLASRSRMDEALSQTNLCMDMGNLKNKSLLAAEKEKAEGEEPVVLDHRLTTTLRNLRHLDYIVSVDGQDVGNDLDNINFESEDYGEFESGDEVEIRSSYASSVAVLDDDYTMCVTPTGNVPEFQRESPIFEVEEDGESEEEAEFKQNEEETTARIGDSEADADFEHNGVETMAKDESKSDTEETGELLDAITERQPPYLEMSNEKKESEGKDDEVPIATELLDEDGYQLLVAGAEDVEVVEAAPIAEVHAMMLSQYNSEKEELQQRPNRAHTTALDGESDSEYQHQLLQQMQDLHDVVESTYQVALANTEAAFKERDSGRLSKTSPGSEKIAHTFYQPFAFNVVGLRSTRAMTVGIDQ